MEDPRYAARAALGRVRFALQAVALIDFFAIAPSVIGLFFGDWDLRVLRVPPSADPKIVRLPRPLRPHRRDVAEWRALMERCCCCSA